MKKIKVAQIGINQNSHSNEIFESVSSQSDIFEFVGFVFPENEKERIPHKYERVKDYPELALEDVLSNPEIEAVIVETDEIYLTKYALLAARANKHLHIEKPCGTSLSGFEELISVIKRTGKVLHSGYMYRYNPYISDLINRVKRGELGEIISVEAQMNCFHIASTRQWLGTLEGGMMQFLGCHLIDLILLLQGAPERVIPLNKSTGLDGISSKDFGMAVLEYKNGVSFAKAIAAELGGFDRRQLVVTGTKATVELKPLERLTEIPYHVQTLKTFRQSTAWSSASESELSPPFNRYDTMMRSFAEYVNGEKENPYTPDYELLLFKTILAACGKDKLI